MKTWKSITRSALMRSRPFVDRVMILGAGVLARQLIEEIEARQS